MEQEQEVTFELRIPKDNIAIVEVINPFRKTQTASGIYLADGSQSFSEETGQMEKLEQTIRFGIVVLTGPDVKTVKIGDGVYYDFRTLRPIPFYEPVWMFNEGNIVGHVPDNNGSILSLVKSYEEERVSKAFNAKVLAGGVEQFEGLKKV